MVMLFVIKIISFIIDGLNKFYCILSNYTEKRNIFNVLSGFFANSTAVAWEAKQVLSSLSRGIKIDLKKKCIRAFSRIVD